MLLLVGVVSIPQSGFGAFEPGFLPGRSRRPGQFQSLSRDSGRLNKPAAAHQPQ